jgi:hypothetical protein
MAELRATPYANPLTGLSNDAIQGLLDYMRDPRRTQQMQGLVGLLESTGIPKTVERAAYADSPRALLDALTNVNRANVPLLKPETAEALMTLSPVPSGANRAAMAAGRAGERVAERVVPQIMERGGLPADLLQGMAQGTQSNVYRKTTPKNPDPSVGTRFEREYMGGLLDKNPLRLEDYEGSSVMIMPWDSTSRNYKILGISDEQLKNPVITHGGQDYARDIAHSEQGIVGASGKSIAKRIRDRDKMARMENLEAGGTGEILHLPVTMGSGSENFSAMPVEVLMNFADRANLSSAKIKEFDDSIRNFKVPKGTGEKRKITYPFQDFKGIMSEEGREQMYSGEGINSTAGELRKAITDRFYLKENQMKFGFNAEDVSAALTDPALVGVPKGYVGNTVIMSSPEGMSIRPSANRTYNTDFTGQYEGTLGQNLPVEVLMAEKFGLLNDAFAGKKGDIRNMVLGALEKRKEGVSQMVDQPMIERYYKYLADQKNKGLLD